MVTIMEQSQVTKKNVWIIGAAVAVCLLYFASSLFRWIVFGIHDPLDLFVGFMLAVVFVERAQSKYTYAAHKKGLTVTKKNILGSKTLEIPYKEIMGIYRYQPKLIGAIKFRRTYRFHSALDGRVVWTVAYKSYKENGKTEYNRVYVKLSPDMLFHLKERMPSKVMVDEKDVVLQTIKEMPDSVD